MADNGDEELYDEFGNYIGPELDSSSDSSSDDGDENDELSDDDDGASHPEQDTDGGALIVADDDNNPAPLADAQNQIVLHEDKEHYASAAQTFGEDVRTVSYTHLTLPTIYSV